MSRRLDRPAGYFRSGDADGNVIEGETRKCVHCGRQWAYVPASGRKRGYCMTCHGILCGSGPCMASCRPEGRRVDEAERRALSGGGVLL